MNSERSRLLTLEMCRVLLVTTEEMMGKNKVVEPTKIS
jgi:hypothetical protein